MSVKHKICQLILLSYHVRLMKQPWFGYGHGIQEITGFSALSGMFEYLNTSSFLKKITTITVLVTILMIFVGIILEKWNSKNIHISQLGCICLITYEIHSFFTWYLAGISNLFDIRKSFEGTYLTFYIDFFYC